MSSTTNREYGSWSLVELKTELDLRNAKKSGRKQERIKMPQSSILSKSENKKS
jgi:hypothetical protein